MDRLTAVAAALTALVAGACGLVGMSESDDSDVADPSFGMSSSDIQEVAAEHAEAPLVLPVSLPRDYGWAGVGREEGDGRTLWARTSIFTSVDGGPTVELCAKGVDEPRGCEPDTDQVVERRWGGLDVYLSFESGSDGEVTPSDLEYWQDADLTTDYSTLTWTS